MTMGLQTVDITTFRRDKSFYPELQLLLTIKSFDLKEIRKRYLLSRQNQSGRTGSGGKRPTAIGGIAALTLRNGTISVEMLAHLSEPRGITSNERYLCISSENKVFVISAYGIRTLTNPWFSYIHGLDIDQNDKLLISSSGFDMVFEYDLGTFRPSFEWCAWEHGFNKSVDPMNREHVLITRDEKEFKQYHEQGQKAMLISDPAIHSLPTARRAAFINSVTYHTENQDSFAATFFHEGAVYEIDKCNGGVVRRMHGLTNPHGGRYHRGEWIAASTAQGALIRSNKAFSIRNLPGKPPELAEMEWVQNVAVLGELYILIDSNRCALILLHLDKQLYDVLPLDEQWAVQDMLPCRPSPGLLKQISALPD